jgi:hypothetical protein
MYTGKFMGHDICLTPTWGDIQFSKFKSFEYQFDGPGNYETNFECKWRVHSKTDHTGISFSLSMFKLFMIHFNIYDCRHWDFEKNCWKVYDHEER